MGRSKDVVIYDGNPCTENEHAESGENNNNNNQINRLNT